MKLAYLERMHCSAGHVLAVSKASGGWEALDSGHVGAAGASERTQTPTHVQAETRIFIKASGVD
jgi:hypothetical protein